MTRIARTSGPLPGDIEPETAPASASPAEARLTRTPTAGPRPVPGAAATAISLPISKGATSVPDRATFDKLAHREDVPGAVGVKEVKFLMTDVDTPHPQVYLINTNGFAYHYDFAKKALGSPLTLEQFNAQTYFTDKRKFMAGSIVAHDGFERAGSADKGLYAVEFWPTDPVRAPHVAEAMEALKKAMPFAASKLAYHPAGETQEALAKTDAAKLKQLKVPLVSTEDLFGKTRFSALNPGEGYGVLRVVDGQRPGDRPLGPRDVVIFKRIPNDLPHVGGVITEEPQTPLAHVNLKARQDHTPNAYLKDASTDPKIKALLGKMVHYKVTPDGVTVEAATEAEAERFLEKLRPAHPQKPGRDLGPKDVVPLSRLSHADEKAFGAKVANVAELRKILPEATPDGVGIPFSFYDTFMKKSGLYDEAKRMMADPKFKADPAEREKQLAKFQKKIKDADIPPELAAKLRAAQRSFPPGTALRCRSSTNNEDLEGFNGAGLYDSYTHRPDEGDIDKSVKQVWASLWNFRAFEEREFYKIDHMSAAMGVLIHPNFDDEGANGVAITKNVFDPNWPGFYVNVQKGENLVTNPTGGATPDEFLISAIGEHGEWETQYIRHSNEVAKGKTVLTKAQTEELRAAMEKIQARFKKVYGKERDPSFGMDIEFKIAKDGHLVVKQARPWLG